MEMAAEANTTSESIIMSSDNEQELSDSDSTDYEPEPKKCKLDREDKEDGGSYLGSDTLVAIPIRATSSVEVYSPQELNEESQRSESSSRGSRDREASSGTSGSDNDDDGEEDIDEDDDEPDNEGEDDRHNDMFSLSVGSLVDQTLDAALGSLPDSQPMSQDLFSQNPPTPNIVLPPQGGYVNASTQMPPIAYGGDFPTIAREVVRRTTVGRNSSVTDERHAQTRRRRRRRRRRRLSGSGEEIDTGPDTPGGSRHSDEASRSSGEYFTDDVDPQDIPSDEYLSPPLASRQRRNAIFLRRDPPPSMQNEDDIFYHNELEVASVLDINENPIEDGSSTSEVDDEVLQRAASPTEQDMATENPLPVETDNNFADNEIARSDADSVPTPQSTTNSNEHEVSDSEASGDREKNLCTQCRAQRAEPCFRLCLRCFKIRRQWLPARPPSRRLKTRKAQMRNSTSLNNSTNSARTRSSSSSGGEDVVDGPIRSQSPPADGEHEAGPSSSFQTEQSPPSSQLVDLDDSFLDEERNLSSNNNNPHSICGNTFAIPDGRSNSNCHSGVTANSTDAESQSQAGSSESQRSLCSGNSQNSEGTPCTQSSSSSSQSQPLQSSSPERVASSEATASDACPICFLRDKDSAFVHNKIAHLYCCYTCADKIMKKTGKCPICRERVLRVVKIISV